MKISSSIITENGKDKKSREIITSDVMYYKNYKGFYVVPKKVGKYPGIVMIHEWWGLNNHTKDMAENLAKEGYQVLAVDLYGKTVTATDEARYLSTTINQLEANRNMIAAKKYLKSHGVTKIGSLGWCFGGRQSLQLAVSGEFLDATVIYYGIPIMDKKKLSKITWPVLGIYGDKDQPIPLEEIRNFEDILVEQDINYTMIIYPGIGHAFANPNASTYAPKETKDAWGKTLQFLNKNLKEK